MGIWSCLGKALEDVRDSLYTGKSGIIFRQERKDAGFRSALCADVERPDLKPFIPRNLRHFMPEEAQYAYMATRSALENAKLDQDYMDRNEIGIIYGNDSVAEATMQALDKFREFRDTSACGRRSIFQSMNSTVTMNLACLFKLRGINLTASAACASGSQAIGLAYTLIRSGMQDCIICGGAQETNLYSVASFDGIQSFSIREDNPAKASRPFDRDRDGLVPGGRCGNSNHRELRTCREARGTHTRRNSKLGILGQWGSYFHSQCSGPARSLELCLNNGGISPQQIGYINAHATSTRIGDSREASAIAQIFGDCRVPVTSTKSQTGHEMWMAGASELIYSMLMMKNDFIAGNINFENPDEETARIHILPETREAHFDMFLSNSFGFGGTNSTLIVRNL